VHRPTHDVRVRVVALDVDSVSGRDGERTQSLDERTGGPGGRPNITFTPMLKCPGGKSGWFLLNPHVCSSLHNA